jgi:hypothetical protein
MWSVSDDERPIRADQTITSEKYILIVLWSIKGQIIIEWLGSGENFGTTYLCSVIIVKLVQALYPGGFFPML